MSVAAMLNLTAGWSRYWSNKNTRKQRCVMAIVSELLNSLQLCVKMERSWDMDDNAAYRQSSITCPTSETFSRMWWLVISCRNCAFCFVSPELWQSVWLLRITRCDSNLPSVLWLLMNSNQYWSASLISPTSPLISMIRAMIDGEVAIEFRRRASWPA